MAAKRVIIPEEVRKLVASSILPVFSPLQSPCTCDQDKISDFLDLKKSRKRAALLARYAPLDASTKLLEIGSGFGTNLAVWLQEFGIDGYGVEPTSPGFDAGLVASRILFSANGLDPGRIFESPGESLPFPSGAFDVVYSANVLEHTADPQKVLSEAVRVLKPGGILQMEMPNFLSYFEGHYMIVMPPVLWRGMLGQVVRFLYRRDPRYARTLRTEIDPMWIRAAFRKINHTMPVRLTSIGAEVFRERLKEPFVFETSIVQSKLAPLIKTLQALNAGNWIGWVITGLQGNYPMYVTARRL
ncbi:MAG: class I SAM-dependent methyltransferase [Acidobacteriaceae bacterium]